MDPIYVLFVIVLIFAIRAMPERPKLDLTRELEDPDFERKVAFWFLAAGIMAVMAYSFFRGQGGR